MLVLESLVSVDEFVVDEYVSDILSSDDYATFSSEDLYEDVLDFIDRIYDSRNIPRNDFLSAVGFICSENNLLML